MTPERYQQLGRLFNEALERPPQERSAWLAEACRSDANLQSDVEKLLANHAESEEFLSQPAMNVAAELLAQQQVAPPTAQRLSHYETLSLLGAGGMGQVYLATDVQLGRQVALKLLPAHLMQNAEYLRRFKREALAASALNHPNILTVYEFGETGGTHFLATEYVQGETLRQCLMRGQLTLPGMLDIMVQIVAALQAAHEAGIIHRDMKPDNVMIRRDGLVKVLDFGLAKLVETRKSERGTRSEEAETLLQDASDIHRSSFRDRPSTLPGTVMGTVAYMSPEQARGQAVDARTDIFSVGVMLYELLTGRQPFTGETVSHTIVAILEQEPPPLARTGRTVPAELERILQRMLAKKLEARYASAAVLLTELKQLAKQVERETALVAPATWDSEALTQVISPKTNEQFGGDTTPLSPDDSSPHGVNVPLLNLSDEAVGNPSVPASLGTAVHATGQASVAALAVAPPSRRKTLLWLGALLVLGLGSVPVWQAFRVRAVNPPTQTTALPERSLSYFLTVQRYRDSKPYQSKFQSSGREIFEPGWQFKLTVTSPQEGYLYLLNETPQGEYVLLFPLPSRNNGSAHLAANEPYQTGAYLFDEQRGTERFRLVWTAQPVPELEAVRGIVNPTDKGQLRNPVQIQAVRAFVQQHTISPPESVRDTHNQQTNVRGTGDVLVALVELEHR